MIPFILCFSRPPILRGTDSLQCFDYNAPTASKQYAKPQKTFFAPFPAKSFGF
jgi:hypothetical protein